MATKGQLEKFIKALADRGSSAGDMRLREPLAWSQAMNDRVRVEPAAAGRISKGHGRGGSFALIASSGQGVSPPSPVEVSLVKAPKLRAKNAAATVNGNAAEQGQTRDVLGRVYECIFQPARRIRGQTRRRLPHVPPVVRVLAEMVEPYRGRITPTDWARTCDMHTLPEDWEMLSYDDFLLRRRD